MKLKKRKQTMIKTLKKKRNDERCKQIIKLDNLLMMLLLF